MCGIALVVENAGVQCSLCGRPVLSYQGLCPHGEPSDRQQKGGGASEKDASIGPSIQDLAHELRRRGPDGVCHVSIPLADISISPADVSNSSADISGHSSSERGPVLHLIGAELQLRGSEVVTQPLEDGCGNVLVFNGEVFGGLSVGVYENDGRKLLEALQSACACPIDDVSREQNSAESDVSRETKSLGGDVSRSEADVSGRTKNSDGEISRTGESSSGDVSPGGEGSKGDVSPEGECSEGDVIGGTKSSASDVSTVTERAKGDVSRGKPSCRRCGRRTVVQILSSIRGPWAIAYWQAVVRTLWYGRDFVGRRSLVAHLPDGQDSRFIVSSVAVSRGFSGLSPVENLASGLNRDRETGRSKASGAGRPGPQPALVNGLNHGLANLGLDQTRSGPTESLGERINESQTGRSNGSSQTDRVNEPDNGLASLVPKASGDHSTSPGTNSKKPADKRQVTGPIRGSASSDPGLEPQSEGEALFGFWVDVPAGVYSYRPENGAHARHAWEDPMVERLSRWQRERVEPPADVSILSGGRQADVSTSGRGRQDDVSNYGEGLRADGLRNGAEKAHADVSRGGEGRQADVSSLDAADISTLDPADIGIAACADVSEGSMGGTTNGAGGIGDESFETAVEKLLSVLSGAVAKRVTGIRRHVAPDHLSTVVADLSGSEREQDSVGGLSDAIESGVSGRVSSEVGSKVSGRLVGGLNRSCQDDPESGFGSSLRGGLRRSDDGLGYSKKRLGCSCDGLGRSNDGLGCSNNGLICSKMVGLGCDGFDGQTDHASTSGKPTAKVETTRGGTADVAIADVAVLFSGGLDSMVLAALADRHVPPEAPIDLINVCFDRGESPDRISALAGLEELRRVAPGRRWQLIEVDSSLAEVDEHRGRLTALICPSQTYMDLNIGAALWLAARAQGVTSSDESPPSDCLKSVPPFDDGRASSDDPLPSNSLGPSARSDNCKASSSSEFAAVSDSLGTFPPPNSLGNFSPLESANIHTPSNSSEACSPLDSVDIPTPSNSSDPGSGKQMNNRDRGKQNRSQSARQTDGRDRGGTGPSDGLEASPGTSRKKCASAAHVLLVGSGADEQCAGYGRHRTKFREGGWQRLDAEMRLDVLRLWQRNLGRDDRCIADHGKEARFPFLDEDVMSFLLSLPLWIVADLRQPLGVGDKRLLRAAARRLGIQGAAALPKRAIQFGSRIARASNRRDFGSNRAANASAAGGASFRRECVAEPS